MRGKVEKYSKPGKVLSSFLFFKAFLAAAHYVAMFSKVDCWSNSGLVSGGNASPTSCGFTHIEFHPLPREAHSPTFKLMAASMSLTHSLALSYSLCELYAAFCSSSCSLLREASATITAVMTKESICSRTGPLLYSELHSFHRLTSWLAAETRGVDHDWHGRSGQRVACACEWPCIC